MTANGINPKRPSYMARTAKPAAKEPEAVEDAKGLLTLEDRERILAELEAELQAEAKKRAEDEFRDKQLVIMRQRKGLSEEQVEVIIDVAGFANNIVLDGTTYWHGQSYVVPVSVASSMLDVMQRTWDHEASIGGANNNIYRKPLNERPGARSFNAPRPVHGHQFAPIVNTSRGLHV